MRQWECIIGIMKSAMQEEDKSVYRALPTIKIFSKIQPSLRKQTSKLNCYARKTKDMKVFFALL